MSATLLFAQLLNGLQYGVLLFLLAAGLTLVFGIMSFVNLAHGSLYMLGAYAGAVAYGATGSFVLSIAAAMAAALGLGLLLEVTVVSRLYRRDHLDHVLATFGLVMFFNELVRQVHEAHDPEHQRQPGREQEQQHAVLQPVEQLREEQRCAHHPLLKAGCTALRTRRHAPAAACRPAW